jgi:hypothetical protein
MNDKTELKKILYSFHGQASRLMRTPFECFEADLSKFLSFLEKTPLINGYIEECVSRDLPEGFDADAEVDAVQGGYGTIFGPFGGSDEEETAEIYLILQAIRKKGISGRGLFFNGYASGSNKYQDMLKNFLDEVAYILVEHIESHLTEIGIEMGLDEHQSQVVSVSNSPNAQVNTSGGQSTLTATQNNNPAMSELEPLLSELAQSARELNKDEKELVDDSIETLREEMASGSPKGKVIRPVLAALKGINESAQFGAAVTQIVAFFSAIL